MNKVVKESVDKIEEKLGSIYEGYLSDLENVFDVRIDEGCSIKKTMKDKEDDEEEDEDEELDSKDTKKDEKVEENVIKNKKGKSVTFSEKDPKDEEVSEFSKDGNKTDGKSGFDDDVKPSSETPDKKVKKKVSENYSSFDEKKDKKKGSLVTIFTKDKKGTDSKTAGFDDENPSEKTYDSDVEREGEGELDKDGTYKGSDMGFKEKEKVGQASTEKKKKFPSKSPSQLGTPGSVKD